MRGAAYGNIGADATYCHPSRFPQCTIVDTGRNTHSSICIRSQERGRYSAGPLRAMNGALALGANDRYDPPPAFEADPPV